MTIAERSSVRGSHARASSVRGSQALAARPVWGDHKHGLHVQSVANLTCVMTLSSRDREDKKWLLDSISTVIDRGREVAGKGGVGSRLMIASVIEWVTVGMSQDRWHGSLASGGKSCFTCRDDYRVIHHDFISISYVFIHSCIHSFMHIIWIHSILRQTIISCNCIH